MTVFFHALFYSTLVPMFTVLDPLLEFTCHLLFSWRKLALCIQSLLCMLFLFGWPPCKRSDMILMEVSQHAYDMIHYISGLFGYFYVCEIYVNLIWYLYLLMLNKFCLSLSLSLSLFFDGGYITHSHTNLNQSSYEIGLFFMIPSRYVFGLKCNNC